MTWECRLIEYVQDFETMRVGDMFFGPAAEDMALIGDYSMWVYLQCCWLSEHYKANNAHRRPLFVVLPGRTLFCLDGQQWKENRKHSGWMVTGEPPEITMAPAIRSRDYHGWLWNGRLSDDVENRRYDTNGNLEREKL